MISFMRDVNWQGICTECGISFIFEKRKNGMLVYYLFEALRFFCTDFVANFLMSSVVTNLNYFFVIYDDSDFLRVLCMVFCFYLKFGWYNEKKTFILVIWTTESAKYAALDSSQNHKSSQKLPRLQCHYLFFKL